MGVYTVGLDAFGPLQLHGRQRGNKQESSSEEATLPANSSLTLILIKRQYFLIKVTNNKINAYDATFLVLKHNIGHFLMFTFLCVNRLLPRNYMAFIE